MNYYQRPYYPDELYHFGVKGMRWGHRKYQNVDGSLTRKGEQKYGTVENYQRARERKRKIVKGVAIAAGTAVALALISNYMGGSVNKVATPRNVGIGSRRSSGILSRFGGRTLATTPKRGANVDAIMKRSEKRVSKGNKILDRWEKSLSRKGIT